jgi:hypothetical protein
MPRKMIDADLAPFLSPVQRNVHRLPIVDRRQRCVGIVTITDIFAELGMACEYNCGGGGGSAGVAVQQWHT